MADIDLTLQQLNRDEEEKHAKDNAERLNLQYMNLVGYPVAPDVLALIPEEQANLHHVVAYLRAGDVVKVATSHPNQELDTFLAQLGTAAKVTFKVTLVSESSIRYGLTLYRTLITEKPKEEKVSVTQASQTQFTDEIKNLETLKEKITSVSATELLDIIFAGAVKNEASDIHIEPGENDFRIRYRIDGVLQDIAKLPLSVYKTVLDRIKFLAKLKFDVKNPQDGRFEVSVLDTAMDIRVSSLPSNYGESVVMRLLPKDKQFVTLETLGFNQKAMDLVNEAISKPQGLILNTGPTGSGKTTTLYAILQKLNQPGRKIITLENPIEYRVEGIEQVQIDTENKQGFLDALKATLRQDPDILMVGEVRDAETANIALQAAMTGHLVLTTLHTNNAPASLARLMEMGIQPYLLEGSINLIIGQRLVRKLCTACQGKGCAVCNNTGFKGRLAIVEVLAPSKELDELINKHAPLREFEETAHELGMQTMYEDGMDKVAQGLTTKEEVERVTKQ